MKNPLEIAIEQAATRGWKAFVKDIQQKAEVSNARLFKILTSIKGEDFVEQLQQFMKTCKGETSKLHIKRKPVGVELTDRRFAAIPTIWVENRSDKLGAYTTICVQIKPDRWVMFSGAGIQKTPQIPLW